MWRLVLACSLLTACQEDRPLPPPPVAGDPSSGPVVPPMGGGGAGDSGSMGEPEPLDSDDLDDDSGTGGSGLVLSGLLLDGTSGLVPDTCRVRLHTLDSLDPGSGIPLEIAFETLVTIQLLPQPYGVYDVPAELLAGDPLYVSTLCDVDGDGALDSFGAYYPQLPLEPISLPSEEIDMTLDFVR